MHGIYHDVPVDGLVPEKIFEAVTTADGLNSWWTNRCRGDRQIGGMYDLYFAPDYHWSAEVRELTEDEHIAWIFTRADEDWAGTRLSFSVIRSGDKLLLRLEHTGWKIRNDHFRHTNYCWAQYLRKLKESLVAAAR